MRPTKIALVFMFAMSVLTATDAAAQRYPERRDIRRGNTLYEQSQYGQSEADYRKGAAKTPSSFAAGFNLGNALYKQERWDEAAMEFDTISRSTQMSADDAARLFFNKGNALFQQKKYQEALEAYKQSLRINPSDLEAKYNLAYTQKMLEKDQNQDNNQNQNDQNQNQDQNDQQNNQNQDQNKDQNQNKDQDQDKNKDQDQNDQDKNQDQNDQDNKDQQNPDNKDQQAPPDKPQPNQQPAEGKMSPDEAAQMLEAVQRQEDKTREKVNEKKAVVVGRSGKNW